MKGSNVQRHGIFSNLAGRNEKKRSSPLKHSVMSSDVGNTTKSPSSVKFTAILQVIHENRGEYARRSEKTKGTLGAKKERKRGTQSLHIFCRGNI